MNDTQLDRLDEIALQVRKCNRHAVGVLSTGEQLYVALAASSATMLRNLGYTIPQALARLGQDDARELVSRWQYRG